MGRNVEENKTREIKAMSKSVNDNIAIIVFKALADESRLKIISILLQKDSYDETRFNYAIEESGLKEKIAGLENGIDTQIGRLYEYYDGLEFSGGEGQKLACARAYYKDAPFVILDEPTASLDPFAETRLYERFNRSKNNCSNRRGIRTHEFH